ncbi:NaeI family type II restriction endonuclease [Streptomyces longisporus]|uniref:NaeI family type II restriction endonuclease n=1 Tax=Streptomyces longisporus TaxID=1948 RepID=UPI0031D6DC43
MHSSDTDREAVFERSSGQTRLNELFRRVQRRGIGRNTVRTVVQQRDYMKRVRGNGGSRSALRNEGIVILGDYDSHRRVARQLGLPVPREGEFISARVAPAVPGAASLSWRWTADSRASRCCRGRCEHERRAHDLPVLKQASENGSMIRPTMAGP